jgi:TolB-like protein/tetratricopeptide (TPR) repeat protein
MITAPISNLIRALHSRKMFQVGILYLGGAWALLEATNFFVQNYVLSQKLVSVVILLLVLGLPAVLVIAWYHGEHGRQEVERSELAILTTLFVLAGIGTYRISTGEETAAFSGAAGARAPLVATTDLGAGSVAILPFTNSTGADSLDWLGPGVSDILTSNLAQLSGVEVVSPQRLFDLLREEGREETESIPDQFALDIASRSGARLMARGSVLGQLGDLTLDAQLIDLSDGTLVGVGRARGSDLFALADTVARELATQVAERTQEVPEARVATVRMERSPLALGDLGRYRDYLSDLRTRWKGLDTSDVEGRFALVEMYGLMPGREAEQRALLTEILDLAEDPRAYEALAELALKKGDTVSAGPLMAKYAEMEGKGPRAALSMGRLLEEAGQHEAAREQYREAISGRAGVPALELLTASYLRENRPTAAREELARHVESADPILRSHALLLMGDAYAWQGLFDESLSRYATALVAEGTLPAKLEDMLTSAGSDVEELLASPTPALLNPAVWRLLEVERGQKALDLIDASKFVHLHESSRLPPVRYHALLYARGRALELLDRNDEALAAYGEILEHWGEALVDVPMMADLPQRVALLAGKAAG